MNNEISPESAGDSGNDVWQKMSTEAEPFDEHMKKNHQEKLQRFMELSGVKASREDEERFNESLQSLNRDSIYHFLNHINGILRGVGKKERGRRNNVQVGDHLAPSKQVQGVVLSETADALKSIDDNKYRAALSYYIINGLHLFPDGNGRTSRAVYEIFENSDFDLASAESLAHHSQHEAYGHGKFEKEKGIQSSLSALTLALKYLKFDLAKAGEIDSRAFDTTTRLELAFGEEMDIYLTDNAKENLSDKEKKLVNRAFMDGDIAVIALSAALAKKGTFGEVADVSTRKNTQGDDYIAFEVTKEDLDTGTPNELAKKTFQGWTADDYRSFMKATHKVQRLQYEKMIDFFKNPDEYKSNSGIRIADWLSGKVEV